MNTDSTTPMAPVKSSSRTGKPLRAMLPRGASCNVCRRRKVKCDGIKPACSQCVKSASRANSIASGGVINCIYDTSISTSTLNNKPSSNKEGANQKRVKRETPEDSDDFDQKKVESDHVYYDDRITDGGSDAREYNGFDSTSPGPSTSLPSKRKLNESQHYLTNDPGGRVGGLISRMGELEKRIANQGHNHNPYQLPPSTLPPLRTRHQIISGSPLPGQSPSYQHLPNYLNLNPSCSRPSSPAENIDNADGYINSLDQQSVNAGRHPSSSTTTSSSNLPYPSYRQQHQQLRASSNSSEFCSPPLTNAQHHMLPALNSNYDPSTFTHYSNESHSAMDDNASDRFDKEVNFRYGSNPIAGEGGAMLERRTSRNGFDESDTRTSSHVIPIRSPLDVDSATSSILSAHPDRRSTHNASFIPIINDTLSPDSLSSNQSYPSAHSNLLAMHTSHAASPGLINTSIPPPTFPLSLASIIHAQHQSPSLQSRDQPHHAPNYQQYQFQEHQALDQRDHDQQRNDQYQPFHPSPDGVAGSLNLDYDLPNQQYYYQQQQQQQQRQQRQQQQQQQLVPSLGIYDERGRSPLYPSSLPPYDVLVRLVRVFFARASVPSSLFDKVRFLKAVEGGKFWAGHDGDYPSSSSQHTPQSDYSDKEVVEWPEEALLHAICGFSCVFVAQDALGTPYWTQCGVEEAEKIRCRRAGTANGSDAGDRTAYPTNDKHNSLARAYHFDMAKRGIDRAVGEMGSSTGGTRGGRGLFQILQAIIISCYIAYASASFTSLWLLCGIATRLCTPLGLNHLPPWDYANDCVERRGTDWKKQARAGGFHPGLTRRCSNGSIDSATDPGGANVGLWSLPRTYAEWYERSITFWTAFAVDRHASASTDWSTSIDELDITTLIPSTRPAPRAALSINHPEFLNEFAKPVNSVGRYVKSVVLLGRVVNYIQRLPRFEDLQHDKDGEGRTASEFMRSVKATPAFLQLDAALGRFRTATSGMLFDKGDHVDGHLASAYVVPHAASILLHEIFTDPFDRSSTSSIARCLASAKCIVNSTYLLYESSNDLSGCDPFLPFCWSIVSRSLIRDHAIKSSWGEHDAAHISRGLAQHCLSFTARCAKLRGTPIAKLLTANLQAMLDGTDPNLRRDAGLHSYP